MATDPAPAAAYLWEFACGHTTAGGNECADECPVCDNPDLVRKTPVPVESLLDNRRPKIPSPDASAAKRCRSCRHWKTDNNRHSRITHPVDPDTYKPMETEFEVRVCDHPKLLFCERPLESDGFAVADGSEYMAVLYTAEDFGCVRHEEVESDAAE